MKVLIDAGAEIDSRGFQGQTPLMLAAYRITNAESIRLLLDAGADVNAQDNYGETPLILAAASPNSNPEALRVLIDAGANVSHRCASGRTALTYAHEHKVAPETMRVLLDAGARIEEKDLGADDDGAVLEQMFADLEEIAFSDMDDE